MRLPTYALHGDYVTVEPFINWDWDWDGRVQKIGPYYRVFKRVSMNWKGNVGNMSMIEDIEMTPKYQKWIDECAQMFGGLDICGLDFLHSKVDDKEYILELNDTAIGLVHEHEREDMAHMRDLVLLRMAAPFPPPKQGEKTASSESKEAQQDKEDNGGEKEAKKQKEGKEKEEENAPPSEKEVSLMHTVKMLEEKVAMLELELAREREKGMQASKQKKGLFDMLRS